jgi:signal transduction histidine kinase
MSLSRILSLRNTLVFRLNILYAGIFALLSFLVFLIIYYRVQSVTMERLALELVQKVKAYSGLMAEEGLAGVKAKITETAEKENPNEEFYRLLDSNGEILATTDMSSWGSIDTHDTVLRLQAGDAHYVFQTLNVPEHSYKARMLSAFISPGVVLQIGETLEEEEGYLTIFWNLLGFLLMALLFLSAIFGWFIARHAILDMEKVTETAREISKGAYDSRVQVKNRFLEIKRLGDTFNHMLDRIQNLLKTMREINDNIAHDLRSPLARIRGIAEMALMTKGSIDDYENMAASIVEECDCLIDLINTMLDITEIEAGIIRIKVEDLDLVELILDAAELFQPIAAEKEIDIKVHLPQKIIFRGDRKNLQRIISNLLENAVKYTPAGGGVSISARTEDDEKIEISIEDTGIGISEFDLPHVFDRFYRCDRSRPKGGIGLGLSLAKALTEAMSGSIKAISTPKKGSSFTVSLPR